MTTSATPGDRPFVDTPVGDREVADRVAAGAASELALAPPVLLRLGMNALYRSGDVVIRVGRPTVDPGLGIELVSRLASLGVPVAKPASRQWYTAEGLTATVWGYVDAVDEPIDWSAVGRAVREVHVLDSGDLPAGYPLPPPSAFPWWDFDRLLVEVADAIDAVALAGLRAVIDRHRGWSLMPDTVICHGDVHPGNVMMTEDGPLLIDWDLMCTAMPGWDHAMLITLAERWGGDANASTAFATGYGTSFAHDERTLALAELRNVAATLMRVKAGLADEAARPEAERRLRLWRGDPDAPLWRAQ